MIDVDKFKIINDTTSDTLTGDFVLKKVCGVIQEQLSPQDIVARYGGEEFIILLPDSEFSTAMNAAEKICHSVQEKHFNTEKKNRSYGQFGRIHTEVPICPRPK
jgi:diguanylate cyclase (GGDEF)-like protein